MIWIGLIAVIFYIIQFISLPLSLSYYIMFLINHKKEDEGKAYRYLVIAFVALLLFFIFLKLNI